MKQTKKINRKGKLVGGKNDKNAEKRLSISYGSKWIFVISRALIKALMKKCGTSKDEVEESYDTFHQLYPSGIIKNEDYINAKTTKVGIKKKRNMFILLF